MHEPAFMIALRHFVNVTKLHPVLVNFTAALIPVSIASDIFAAKWKNTSLRDTAWWTILYAMIVTPFTVLAGWLFWAHDDNGSQGMFIHKWLGTALGFLLIGLFLWRRDYYRKGQWPSVAYIVVGLVFVAFLVLQGHLGGEKVFHG